MSTASLRLGLVVAAVGLAAAAPLRFETAFATTGEPAALHFTATYLVHGAPHRLEVWRDGDRRVKRVTDRAVATYAVHTPGDADFRMTIVDPRKRVVTTIDRTNLYRLGNFTDWYDLTHGLRHPKGAYRLIPATAPRGTASAGCAWYDLTTGPATTHVCWGTADRLPLVIVDGAGTTVWRTTRIDHGPIGADVFRVADRGFVHVDANRDLDRD